ncbi:integral membrane protein [Colletotrichum tabaci]|uniref:Integral membrane protein n=1 Tax=Colletotrichum tabaci TaxID=1209068 RepID=A0AAV9T8L1_9PEZI
MSHRQPPPQPTRGSRPQTAASSGPAPKASGTKAPAPSSAPAPKTTSKQSTITTTATTTATATTTTPILAAPKPVRPVSSTLQPPAPQWTGNPSPPSYTSFNVPPPASPAPNPGAGGLPAPSRTASSPGVSTSNRLANLRSPGPGALTSFPTPPTPPQQQREATSYFPKDINTTHPPPKKPSTPVPAPTRRPPLSVVHGVLTPPEKATSPVEAVAPETKQRPGVIDFDNLEETLQNLRFAPSPMLSTIYSVPSTPRDELTTPDFPTGATSCFTPPSTNPTPEPLTPLDPTPPRGGGLPLPAAAAAAAAIKEPVIMPPTRPRANSRRASPPNGKRGRAVVACIDTPVTFSTTWYAHPAAPDFLVCSRCYEDHLVGTRFEHDFRGKVCGDGEPRACRFSKPRVRDHLLRATLATGRIEDLVGFLRHRSAVPDCKGSDGVRGSERGAKWFRPRNNAVPNMVVCEACFEDHVQPYRFAAQHFEPAAGQAPGDVWSCDLSIPRIRNAYRAAAARDDWAGFAKEAAARMNMPACAGRQKVTVGSRRWFTPATNGRHEGVLVCAACYSDHVVGSGEEHRWRQVAGDDHDHDGLASRYGSLVYCALGHFNVGVAMARAVESGDASVFWRALDAVCREEFCHPRGIKDGTWYTFPSHPEDFAICAACVAAVASPLGLASSLVPRCGVPPGATITCSLNPASPRFASYAARLREAFLAADAQPLEAYALEFASLPPCPRDEDVRDRRWYGWRDGCVACPSCYRECVRGTALAASMPLRGDVVAASLACEMYSPRMRALYADACARSPPDASALLEAGRRRRAVYVETVPAIREMVMGLQGSLCGNQVDSILAEYGSASRTHVLRELERRWREVE